jgi:N6-L-threonylcarbamoyladenine synthase
VIDAALQRAGVTIHDVDCIAATAGPGLATSLMLGASAAKGIAVGLRKPFVAINHLEGHLLSPFFRANAAGGQFGEILPSIGLVVSGGHTLLVNVEAFADYKLLGQTHDDAAGEAFDKVGKLLGLPYPAGPVIDRLAKTGNARLYDFPRSMIDSGDFSFSFSGLKTSVRYMLPKIEGARLEDVCASFQEAVVDVLVSKTVKAAHFLRRKRVALSGGVSCNTRLREKMATACAKQGVELLIAEPSLCTDNAAMIAFVAMHQFRHGRCSPLTADINPNLRLV